MIFFDPNSKKITLAVIISVVVCGFIFYFWADRNPFIKIDRNRGDKFWHDIQFVGTEKLQDIQSSISSGFDGTDELAQELVNEGQRLQLVEEAKKYVDNKANEEDESKFPIVSNQEECEEYGGEWGTHGEHEVELCNFITTDGGTECTDSSQCQAHCFANLPEIMLKDLPVEATGTCSDQSIWSGCWSIVEDGFVYGVICE